MTETYQAYGICDNCGRRDFPQWGEYEVGKKIEEYPCPNCGCMTWRADLIKKDDDVGKCYPKT